MIPTRIRTVKVVSTSTRIRTVKVVSIPTLKVARIPARIPTVTVAYSYGGEYTYSRYLPWMLQWTLLQVGVF